MGKSKILEITIFGLWLFIAVVLFLRMQPTEVATVPIVNEDKVQKQPYEVKKISVIDGNTFDVMLKDKDITRVFAVIPVKGVTESKKKLIELFNHCENPKILMKQKDKDGKWTVDFTMKYDSKEINLVDWMKSNNLVYE